MVCMKFNVSHNAILRKLSLGQFQVNSIALFYKYVNMIKQKRLPPNIYRINGNKSGHAISIPRVIDPFGLELVSSFTSHR